MALFVVKELIPQTRLSGGRDVTVVGEVEEAVSVWIILIAIRIGIHPRIRLIWIRLLIGIGLLIWIGLLVGIGLLREVGIGLVRVLWVLGVSVGNLRINVGVRTLRSTGRILIRVCIEIGIEIARDGPRILGHRIQNCACK